MTLKIIEEVFNNFGRSEDDMISTRCISGFMANSQKYPQWYLT